MDDPIKSNLLGGRMWERDKGQGRGGIQSGCPWSAAEKCDFSKRSLHECISQLTDTTFLPTITDPQF